MIYFLLGICECMLFWLIGPLHSSCQTDVDIIVHSLLFITDEMAAGTVQCLLCFTPNIGDLLVSLLIFFFSNSFFIFPPFPCQNVSTFIFNKPVFFLLFYFQTHCRSNLHYFLSTYFRFILFLFPRFLSLSLEKKCESFLPI